jgi:hypothetical protein
VPNTQRAYKAQRVYKAQCAYKAQRAYNGSKLLQALRAWSFGANAMSTMRVSCATRDDEPRPVWTRLPITH